MRRAGRDRGLPHRQARQAGSLPQAGAGEALLTVSVRPALPDDFERVTGLLEELGRPKVLGTDQEEDRRRDYLAWLAEKDLFAFVAEEDARVVGFVDVHILPRLNFGAPQAWIPDLIVSEEARSRGAGRALLARAEELAREQGAFALTLESANWRTRAHAFYLREGMKDGGKQFLKVLGDFGWPPPPPSEG